MASPRSFLPGVVTGDTALDTIGLRLDRLFDTGVFWLTVTSAGSEGDAVTADIKDNADTPATDAVPLERGWLNGMGVALIWPATNTGAVTLNVNGSGALDVLTPEGDAIAAGQLPAGTVVQMVYAGGDLIVVSPLPEATSGPQARYFEQFTSSGTWTKPSGLGDDTVWNVAAWGAGGGSSTSYPGGGGGYSLRRFRNADLPSTVTVTIGAGGVGTTSASGGASGAAGGNTTFGALLTAYGGGPGRNITDNAGGGGGVLSAGTSTGNGRLHNNMWGGGRGQGDVGLGGDSVWGGGGGARTAGNQGESLHGGDGGDLDQNGAAPGGGAGRRTTGGPYNGGRGELWIWN